MPELSDAGEFHMILQLRQRHRRMVMALAAALPFVFTIGIAARKPAPIAPSLLAEPAALQVGSATTVWDRWDLFPKTAIQVRLLRENNSGGRFALKLSAKDFVKPDLLVYWVAQNSKTTDTIPDNAVLLGAFSGDPLLLPRKEVTEDSCLLLYSLADHEIVAISKPFSAR
jgi:hypothetical protein